MKEQQEWKIPPCISNWKNARGYTIPLDKRLAADGRGLQVNLYYYLLSKTYSKTVMGGGDTPLRPGSSSKTRFDTGVQGRTGASRDKSLKMT